jgi:hypothetical protein
VLTANASFTKIALVEKKIAPMQRDDQKAGERNAGEFGFLVIVKGSLKLISLESGAKNRFNNSKAKMQKST